MTMTTTRCPNCNALIDARRVYCAVCGAML